MNENQKHFDWIFLAWWIGATILGGLIGNFVADAPVFTLDQDVLTSMLKSGIYSLVISTFQWILLRRRFAKSGLWILAGTLGRAIGMMLGMFSNIFFRNSGTVLQWTTLALVRGTVLGISQWIVLKQWRTKAGWWVLANAVGWTLGSLLVFTFIDSTTAFANILNELIWTAAAGGVTGISMVWILRQPTPESKGENEDESNISIKNLAGFFLVGALVGLVVCPVLTMIRLGGIGSLDVVALIIFSPIAGAITGAFGGVLGGSYDKKMRGAAIGAASLAALFGLLPELWARILFQII